MVLTGIRSGGVKIKTPQKGWPTMAFTLQQVLDNPNPVHIEPIGAFMEDGPIDLDDLLYSFDLNAPEIEDVYPTVDDAYGLSRYRLYSTQYLYEIEELLLGVEADTAHSLGDDAPVCPLIKAVLTLVDMVVAERASYYFDGDDYVPPVEAPTPPLTEADYDDLPF